MTQLLHIAGYFLARNFFGGWFTSSVRPSKLKIPYAELHFQLLPLPQINPKSCPLKQGDNIKEGNSPSKQDLRLTAATDSGFFHLAGILQQERGLTAICVVKILQDMV